MSSSSKLKVLTFAVCVSVVPGCANMSGGQQQATGAAAGGLLVGGLCALAGGNAATCGALAAAGMAAGWGAVALNQYHEAQVRSASQAREIVGLNPGEVSSPVVKIKQGTTTPSKVKRGQELPITTEYDVVLPSSTPLMEVEQVLTVKKDGKDLKRFDPIRIQRAQGGFKRTVGVPIPSDLTPGTYTIEQRVTCGPSYDVRESSFYVEA